METITSVFAPEHAHCDKLFSATETHVHHHDWDKAQASFSDFVRSMERHFSKEEEILFPAFEQRTGASAGPTQVMRLEHRDMRQLMKDMQEDISTRNAAHFLGLSETLIIMMQQHNYKEENILYQMADKVLAGDLADILARTRSE